MEHDEISYQEPEYYYAKLAEIYLGEDELEISSDFEARAMLVKLKKVEKDLSKLKRTISTDMRTIRNIYLDESVIEKPKFLGLFSVGKKLTKTQKRKKLLFERQQTLKPYEEIIEIIEDYSIQIEDFGKYIERESLETYAPPEYTKVYKK